MNRVWDRRRYPGICTVFALVALGVIWFATAGVAAEDPELLPKDDQDECLGVPDCVAVPGELLTLGPQEKTSFEFQCPEAAPYFWNWGLQHSRHVSASLVRTIFNAETGRTGRAVIRVHYHLASGSGQARVFLGCSAQRFQPTGQQSFRFNHIGTSEPSEPDR